MTNIYHDPEQRVHNIANGNNRRFTPDRLQNEFFEAFTQFYLKTELNNKVDNFNYEIFFDFVRKYDRGVSPKKKEIETFYKNYINKKRISDHINCRSAIYNYMSIFNQIVENKLDSLKYYKIIFPMKIHYLEIIQSS